MRRTQLIALGTVILLAGCASEPTGPESAPIGDATAAAASAGEIGVSVRTPPELGIIPVSFTTEGKKLKPFTVSNGIARVFRNLKPGTYTVRMEEVEVPGTVLRITCFSEGGTENNTISEELREVRIQLEANESVRCVFAMGDPLLG